MLMQYKDGGGASKITNVVVRLYYETFLYLFYGLSFMPSMPLDQHFTELYTGNKKCNVFPLDLHCNQNIYTQDLCNVTDPHFLYKEASELPWLHWHSKNTMKTTLLFLALVAVAAADKIPDFVVPGKCPAVDEKILYDQQKPNHSKVSLLDICLVLTLMEQCILFFFKYVQHILLHFL